MKTCWILALLCCTVPGLALGAGLQKAKVHAMRKVHCTTQNTGGILATIVGSGDGESECFEYELRTEKVTYFIRPNRAILLLLDSDVSIRLAGNELLLHTSESVKDIRCNVISMSLRSDSEKKERNYQDSRRCRTESGKEIPCSDEPEDVRYQVAP
jgi:hypothetical protein